MELKTKLNNIVNNYNTTNVKEICDYLDIVICLIAVSISSISLVNS